MKTPTTDADGFSWRLRHLMAERRIASGAELHRRLVEQGLGVSRVQVTRMVRVPPERLPLASLVALCAVLDCTPNDLIALKEKSP